MSPSWSKSGALCGLVLLTLLVGQPCSAHALEEGEVAGKIKKKNHEFLRDYEELDYKGKQNWQAWGRGRVSLGWIVVRRESGGENDLLLLVIDSRTAIRGTGPEEGRFTDLRAGDRIRATYRMGWDALHALEVKKLDE